MAESAEGEAAESHSEVAALAAQGAVAGWHSEALAEAVAKTPAGAAVRLKQEVGAVAGMVRFRESIPAEVAVEEGVGSS